ncbi:Dynein heavy chain 10, axonemal [Cryptotermes secundus]|uniref:Dynein heavy chain 10, axonemal n=1 Tax=Cryptotermes secundus TaxID=105785 RepID=A0A2J7QWX6_9NEOP|nr:Dynein heavy chain 10, axonemal [Cryptotermes secundus]
MGDVRMEWVKGKALKYMDEINGQLFEDMLADGDGHLRNKLMSLLDEELSEPHDVTRRLFFLYKTHYEKIMQEDKLAMEPARRPSSPPSETEEGIEKSEHPSPRAKRKRKGKKSGAKEERGNGGKDGKYVDKAKMKETETEGEDQKEEEKEDEGEVTDSTEGEEVAEEMKPEGTEKESKKKKGGGKKKEGPKGKGVARRSGKAGKKGRKSPTTLVELVPEPEAKPEPESETEYVKRLLHKVVQAPRLHIQFGSISPDEIVTTRRYVFFLRSCQEGIRPMGSTEEATAEMPRNFLLGSCRGRFLHSVQHILRQVYVPLIQCQFREPMLSDTEQETLNRANGDELSGSTFSFTRPSAFRRLSLAIERNLNKQSGTQIFKKRKPQFAPDSQHPTKKLLLAGTNRLIGVFDWTIRHVEGDIMLPLPHIAALHQEGTNAQTLAKDSCLVQQLEEVVMSWERHVTKTIESYLAQRPVEPGPLAEYDYWQERDTGLAVLVEQLKSPSVMQIFKILYEARSQIGEKFSSHQEDLLKLQVQAHDNVKFLLIILKYFKTITHSDKFPPITGTLYPLMEGLHMLWVLSRFYCSDEQMMALMERIAWMLCSQAKTRLAVRDIFSKPMSEVLPTCTEAIEMLHTWKEAYYYIRLKIEQSGKEQRWEFDKKKLFGEADYIASVAKDIFDVAKVICRIENIFGPDLKSVTSDPSHVDAVVKKVEKLVISVSQADFDIFHQKFQLNWQELLRTFYRQVSELEIEAKYFIDESFKVLRSSEEALGLLLKFQHIETTEAIHERLMSKFGHIMQQFTKEILSVETEFNKRKRYPPLLRNHPPISGAIFWSRHLFNRLKKSVLIFQNVEELKNSSFREEAFSVYLKLGKQMKMYEDTKFSQWQKKSVSIINSALKKNVLKVVERKTVTDKGSSEQRKSSKVGVRMPRTGLSILKTRHAAESVPSGSSSLSSLSQPMPSARRYKLGSLNIGALALTMKWVAKGRGKTPTQIAQISPTFGPNPGDLEKDLCFETNLSKDIFAIIAEAELMEQLGFALEPTIRSVAVQKDRLHRDLEAVQTVIKEYNTIVESLTVAEARFLMSYTLLFINSRIPSIEASVERHVQPGLTRLNWNSLGIEEYSRECHQILKNLASLVAQMGKLGKEVQDIIDCLEKFDFFYFNKPEEEPARLSCTNFFIKVEKFRMENLTEFLKLYKGLGPLLMKLESLVLRTRTGQSPLMIFYFEFWEKNMFNTLIRMVVNNLRNFNDLLLGKVSLFQVETSLAVPEVVLLPAANDIYNSILRSIRGFLEKLKRVPRWMNGSCLECEPVKASDTNQLYTFSFFEDVVIVPVVSDMVLRVQDTAHRLVSEVQKYLKRWKKYKNLWSFDKNITCDRFSAKNPTLLQYDEKFVFYERLIKDIDEVETYRDIYCTRVNLVPIIEAVKFHANEWKRALGHRLADNTERLMLKFKDLLVKLDSDIQRKFDDLEGFKFVLTVIRTITRMSVNAELTYRELQERYHTLSEHKVPAPEEDEDMAHEVQRMWEALYVKALSRSLMLESTKARFAKLTVEEIEEFLKIIADFVVRFEEEGPGSVGQDLDSGLLRMDEYRPLLLKLEEKRLDLVNAEMLFDLPLTDYSSFIKCKTDMEGFEEIYKLYKEQKAACEVWSKTLWVNFNPEVLFDGMENFMREFRCFNEAVKQLPVGHVLGTRMEDTKNAVSLFVELKNDALRGRHWQELMDKTGHHLDMSADRFTLESMFAMQLHRYRDIAEEIVANALKELEIEKGVKEISEVWSAMKFTAMKHIKENYDRGFILGPVDDIVLTLDDNFMSLQRMAASQFVGPFLTVVQKWEKTLSLISEVMDEWLSVQRKWLYMEGIFVGEDVRQELPEEARKFDGIDMEFRKMMCETAEEPNVKACCEIEGRLSDLQRLNHGLEQCQKSLTDYLDAKRNVFPRFFFIADVELLSILGSSDPSSVEEYTVKMFDNMGCLRIDSVSRHGPVASAVISCEGEVMELRETVPVAGRVEEWMNALLDGMRATNRYITKKAIFDYGKVRKPRTEWMLDYQGMVCLAANRVWWTAEVENVFEKVMQGEKRAMKEYLEVVNGQLDELVARVRSHLTKIHRRKFNTVLIIDIHARDTIEAFVRDSILNAQEFEWETQLKFYWWKPFDNLVVRQCTGSFDYGYEYMGLSGRLVVTPLTDRIYLTMTHALSMQLGCAIGGSAGTGKTETVKDLAKALGLLCVVTNCSEVMDCKTIGKTLCGLCQCGAWGCFDEFNRIDFSVLSVISTQLQTIRSALFLKLTQFYFQGQETALDRKVGIFVTMNPGNAGRTELPESVKSLFRPAVCTAPDLEVICLTILFSEGFSQAKVLAKKITVLYKLTQEQLSKQNHYDFGLRTLKAVLVMAGELKRDSPDLPENVVLMRALRDMTLPKFVPEDVPLFLGLIRDLFPGLECPRASYPDFNAAVEAALAEEGYVVLPAQVGRVMQLYETMMTRHSAVIVGPTGGGKTVVIETLVKAQTSLGLATKLFVLNPKACSVTELYGALHPITRDWTDGLLSCIFRDINRPTDKMERRYVLFDGDVDPLWTENMNSVMDDNKILTLANGERIRLLDHCALLFEAGSLQYASPATVSRAGVVYVEPRNLGYKPYWDRWLRSRPGDEEKAQLEDLFVQYVDPQIKHIIEGQMGLMQATPLKTVIPQRGLNMIMQLCFMIDVLIPAREDPSKQVTGELLECLFLQALYCSLGASLETEGRSQFDIYTKKLCGMPKFEDTLDNKATVGNLPSSQPTLYDYYFDHKNRCWMAWKWTVPEYVHDREKQFSEILVPTVDTVRTTWLLKLLNEVRRPVILVGESGTSKTAIMQDFLRQLHSDPYVEMSVYQRPPQKKTGMILNINFSSRSTSLDVQRNLESVLEKRTKYTYGPPIGKKLICFIDDLNMPQVDEYGTQQPIALLKLLFERGGFYNRGKHLSWKNVKDLGFFAAMGKAGGGRNELDPRFVSTFCSFNLTSSSDDAVKHIYRSILIGHTEGFIEDIRAVVPIVVEITLGLYKAVMTQLPPTPSRFHYIFSLRDLSRICAGMLLTTSEYMKSMGLFVRAWRNEFTRVICDRLISVEDQRSWIKIECARGRTARQCHQGLQEACGESALPYRTVARWVKAFNEGCQNVADVRRPGLPSVMHGLIKKRVEENFPGDLEYIMRDPLLFGDYRNAMNGGEPRIYEDLLDYDAIYYLFQEILEEYNEKHNRLHLVLFDDALEHLTRVHRVLRMHKGHVMVVGVGGSGKQSLLRLAAFAAGCEVFQITMNRGYTEANFKEDLKKLYNLIGVANKPTVFLFTTSQVADEGKSSWKWTVNRRFVDFLHLPVHIAGHGFLDPINNMLLNGMVPALFTDDEKEEICASIRNTSKDAGFGVTREAVWRFFTTVCNNNLHVGLCTAPSADILRNRCREFPALFNNTSIDWFFPWPQQALLAVASVFLAENPRIPEPFRKTIVEHVAHVHSSADAYTRGFLVKLRRRNYVTPKHYLDFINTYLKLLDEKNIFIKAQCERLRGGMNTILEASEKLKELNAKLEIKKISVAEKTAACEQLFAEIEEATAKANKKKEAATVKCMELEEQGKTLAAEKSEVEEALAEALPALEAARFALSQLDKSDITEIRSFATPPEPVMVVCECVAIIGGCKDVSWEVAKGMMTDPNFLQTLQETNCDSITGAQFRAIRAHMKKLSKIDHMAEIGKAGQGLLRFIEALLMYCAVYREVKPQKDRVSQLQGDYEQAKGDLDKLNSEINTLEEDLKALELKYGGAMGERHRVGEEADIMQRRIVAADKLISGLSTKEARWSEELANLREEREMLLGDCLISASFLSYTGVFSWEFRRQMLYEDWEVDLRGRGLPLSKHIRPEKVLSNDVEISRWISEGLSPDELSVQNGILTTRASHFPLCIDPQQQALHWIRKKEEKQNLKILSFTDPGFLRHLEVAMKCGFPVLFQDIDDYIDPVIDDVLEKNIKVLNGRSFVVLGDKEADYDSNFRMYFTTKLANPVFSPAVYAKTTVINYTVTDSNLEDQLLSVVVRNERCELEEQREKLIEEMFRDRNHLKDLEDCLLQELSVSTGNILNNTELVATLEETKEMAEESYYKFGEFSVLLHNHLHFIYEDNFTFTSPFTLCRRRRLIIVTRRLELASETAKDIERLREGYRPVAERGAILFFVLLDMARVNPMYQYSLSAYMQVFATCARRALPDTILSKRLTNIIIALTKAVYDFGCTGMLEEHKLLFSLHMAMEFEQSHGNLTQEEVDFFIKGSASLTKSERASPAKWIPAQGWEDIMKLSTDFAQTFENLPNDIDFHADKWKEWYELGTPETVEFPDGYTQKTNTFQKLMLLRCFRADRVYRAVTNYITEVMGVEYITPPIISLGGVFELSAPTTPVVFILTPGFDPTSDLRKLADGSASGGSKFRHLALGHGQELTALKMLETAVVQGQWLLLQNCHLLPALMKILQKEVEQETKPHPDFRLWITTAPTPAFPVVVIEPPDGLKLNLRSTYLKLRSQTVESCGHPAFRTLVYVLAFFHAVVQVADLRFNA